MPQDIETACDENASRLRLQDAADGFSVRCSNRNLADGTQDKYRREMREFVRFCLALADPIKYVDQIDRKTIDAYVAELASKRLDPHTVRCRLGILMAFTGDLFARREIEIDPMHKYPRPKVEDRLRPFLEHEQAIDLLKGIDRTSFVGARLAAYLMICYHTAARGGAVMRLNWGHIDFARKCIHVRIKGGKIRPKHMNGDLEAELRAFRSKWAQGTRSLPDAPVFTARTGNRWKLKYLYPSLKRFGLRGCGSRLLRRSALTCVGDEFTIQTVKGLADHANIASSDPYLQAPQSHVVAAAEHLSAVTSCGRRRRFHAMRRGRQLGRRGRWHRTRKHDDGGTGLPARMAS